MHDAYTYKLGVNHLTDAVIERIAHPKHPPSKGGLIMRIAKVDVDAEIIMFSPQHEHSHVINHMIKMVSG